MGKAYHVKISDFGTDNELYASDYYKVDMERPLPIRWMAWESLFLVSIIMECKIKYKVENEDIIYKLACFRNSRENIQRKATSGHSLSLYGKF